MSNNELNNFNIIINKSILDLNSDDDKKNNFLKNTDDILSYSNKNSKPNSTRNTINKFNFNYHDEYYNRINNYNMNYNNFSKQGNFIFEFVFENKIFKFFLILDDLKIKNCLKSKKDLNIDTTYNNNGKNIKNMTYIINSFRLFNIR